MYLVSESYSCIVQWNTVARGGLDSIHIPKTPHISPNGLWYKCVSSGEKEAI